MLLVSNKNCFGSNKGTIKPVDGGREGNGRGGGEGGRGKRGVGFM